MRVVDYGAISFLEYSCNHKSQQLRFDMMFGDGAVGVAGVVGCAGHNYSGWGDVVIKVEIAGMEERISALFGENLGLSS